MKFQDIKLRMEVSGLSHGPFVFERCGYETEASTSWKNLNEVNFHETLEALAEAVKNGGIHPECPVPDRAMADVPPVTPEAAAELNAWARPKPCKVADMAERRDASKEPDAPSTAAVGPATGTRLQGREDGAGVPCPLRVLIPSAGI